MVLSVLPSDWVVRASIGQVLAVAVVAVAIAGILYYRALRSASGLNGLSRPWAWGLFAARLLVAGWVAFLLLEPLIQWTDVDEERPQGVLLVDTSASVALHADSAARTAALRAWTAEAAQAMADRGWEPAVLGFDGDLRPLALEDTAGWHWQGERTDIAGALQGLSELYENRNVAGVIWLSDGLSNRGADPEFGGQRLPVRHFAVGLGDTTDRPDRWIERVQHNRIAFQGNLFPIEATVGSRDARFQPGEAIAVELWQEGTLVGTQSWTPRSREDVGRLRWMVAADEPGTRAFEVRCAVGSRERITRNNVASFYVDVLDRRRRVLLCASAPHPDLGAVIRALDGSTRYDLAVRYAGGAGGAAGAGSAGGSAASAGGAASAAGQLGTWGQGRSFEGLVREADVIVVHDLEPGAWANAVREVPGSVWWMAGPRGGTDAVEGGMGYRKERSDLTHRVGAAPAPGFVLFQWPEGWEERAAQWPPVTDGMGAVVRSAPWQPALLSQVGPVTTDAPLLAFRTDGANRRWAISHGEGWWRWRTSEHARHENAEAFDALVVRTVQYLASKDDIRRFRVEAPQRLEADLGIPFRAQVFDASLEPLPGQAIHLTLTDDAGTAYDYDFAEAPGGYALDIGRMPAGRYRWRASVNLEGTPTEATGELVLEEIQAEWTTDRADFGLLTRVSNGTGGGFLGPIDEVTPSEAVDALGEAVPLLHESIELQELIHWRWLLLALLAFLTLEWVVRRRTVGY